MTGNFDPSWVTGKFVTYFALLRPTPTRFMISLQQANQKPEHGFKARHARLRSPVHVVHVLAQTQGATSFVKRTSRLNLFGNCSFRRFWSIGDPTSVVAHVDDDGEAILVDYSQPAISAYLIPFPPVLLLLCLDSREIARRSCSSSTPIRKFRADDSRIICARWRSL